MFAHASASTTKLTGTPAYERVERRCERGVSSTLDRIVRDERGAVAPD